MSSTRFARCIAPLAALTLLASGHLAPARAATPAPGMVVLPGLTPIVVQHGLATMLGAHDPAAPLSINVGLPLRNQAALNDFIANQASHGIYLTQDQFNAQFGATPQQVQAVESWAAAYGLRPSYASGDGTQITLRGTTAAVQAALHVAINDYRRRDGVTFFANAADPSVPAALGVVAIDGLNSIPRFHTLSRTALRAQLRAAALRSGGYFPSDFRGAYHVGGYSAAGQAIGLTLWGAPVPNSDLASFAAATGEPRMSGAVTSTPSGSGADTIDWVYTNGVDTTTDAQIETAMDVEYSHGMAPHAHLVYYLGDQVGVCPFSCGGSYVGLENAVSMAANNTIGIHAVSNSWGGGEAPSATDPFVSMTNASFLHAAAVGITFYFSSGDAGTDSGGIGMASYPADSPYVVAVGGTTLNTNADYTYASEGAWQGGGAGCSTVFARPSWQAGASSPRCTMRAVPDVSADADPNTGADVFVSGTHEQVGGTSLAAPLWAGMAVLADAYAAANGDPRVGWAAPKIYANGLNGIHDVIMGSVVGEFGGPLTYNAAPGWDQATGWGSPDWFRWTQAVVGPAYPSITADWCTTGNAICIQGSGFTPGGQVLVRILGYTFWFQADSFGALSASAAFRTNICGFRSGLLVRATDVARQLTVSDFVQCGGPPPY